MLGEDVHRLLVGLAERQAAITAAQVALHRLVELGLDRDGAGGAVAAQECVEAMAGAGGVPATVTDASGASPGRTAAAKQCAACGKRFQPGPRARKRTYCSDRCRSRAAAERRRERLAAEDRRQAAAVMAQAESDGFASTLSWRNGDATSAPKR